MMNISDFIASGRELYQRHISPICEKYDLTSMELAIILFLANNPKYDTASDIIEIRHLTKSHVSTSIRSLEERKYLKKEYRNGNHRTSHLVLLPASKKAVKDGQRAQKDYLDIMANGFSSSELALLQQQLSRVYENVTRELEKEKNKKQGK